MTIRSKSQYLRRQESGASPLSVIDVRTLVDSDEVELLGPDACLAKIIGLVDVFRRASPTTKILYSASVYRTLAAQQPVGA